MAMSHLRRYSMPMGKLAFGTDPGYNKLGPKSS
jgi:hypothetical protein